MIELMVYLIVGYVIFCKLWPYFLYPNYFRKSKIESYTELVSLALQLKSDTKIKTIENAYAYMQEHFSGSDNFWKIKNLLSIFKLGDFSTKEILDKKQFLWCHNQNRLLKSILVNTKMFGEDEIVVKRRFFTSFFIHQWLNINLDDRIICIDSYYNIFKIEEK